MTPFEQGVIAHLVADWIFQNDWMAKNKHNLLHPAAWVHAGIHTFLLGMVLGWQQGVILGATHLFVDTRLPLRWWQRFYGQTNDGEVSLHVAIWTDQVIHLVLLAIVIALQDSNIVSLLALNGISPDF